MMGSPSGSVFLSWMILLLSVDSLYGWVSSSRLSDRRTSSPQPPPSTRCQSTVSSTSPSSSLIPPPEETEIPANLKRKVKARRPFLGHIVPKHNRPKTGGSNAPALRAQGQQADYTQSQLRIAAGTARGRKIDSPNVVLRPMMGKVKEAVFSTLTAVGIYDYAGPCRHLDVFAGSDATGLGPGTVQCMDAFVALQQDDGTKYHVITICPPYEEVVYADLLQAAVGSPMVMEDTILVIEYPVELLGDVPHVVAANNHTAIGIRNRRYGRTVIAIYIVDPTGRLNAYSRPEEFVLPSKKK